MISLLLVSCSNNSLNEQSSMEYNTSKTAITKTDFTEESEITSAVDDNISKITRTETDLSENDVITSVVIDDSVIIVELYEVSSTDVYENTFNISSDEALDLAYNTALSNNMVVENDGTELVLNNIEKINECEYYSISFYENVDPEYIHRLFNLSVDVQSGNVYLNYDPTLNFNDDYKDIVGEIDENDGRTRLIKLCD